MSMVGIWIALLAGALLVEAATVSLVSIWLAFGAAVAAIAAGLDMTMNAQIWIFLIVSLALLLLLRPLAKAQLERSKKPTNVDSFIGQDGIVLEAINNELDQGLIRFKGIEWRARSVSGERIGAGRKVTIVQIKGVTLLVK